MLISRWCHRNHFDDTLPKPVLQKQTLDGDDGVWNSPLVEKKNSWKLWNNNKENSSQPMILCAGEHSLR